VSGWIRQFMAVLLFTLAFLFPLPCAVDRGRILARASSRSWCTSSVKLLARPHQGEQYQKHSTGTNVHRERERERERERCWIWEVSVAGCLFLIKRIYMYCNDCVGEIFPNSPLINISVTLYSNTLFYTCYICYMQLP